MKQIEQELKLLLTEREYNILADLAHRKPQLQTNFYFAYEGMPHTMMVRIRCKGDSFVLCCKQRLSHSNGVAASTETECTIDGEHANYIIQRGVTPDEMRKLLGVHVPDVLAPMGRLDTFRTAFDLQQWHLELDKNQYLGRTDYELECENDDVQQLQQLKDYLYCALGIVAKPSKAKSERFWEALK